MELADYARRNAREAAARNQNDLRLKTIKGMRAEQEALHQRRLDLQRASTVVESLTALKCFEIADLGQGHAAGGTADEHQEQNECVGQDQAAIRPAATRAGERLGLVQKKMGQESGGTFAQRETPGLGTHLQKHRPPLAHQAQRRRARHPQPLDGSGVPRLPVHACTAMLSNHPRSRGPALRW